MRTVTVAAVAAAVTLAPLTPAATSAGWVAAEAGWIVAAQHPSGAICHHVDCVAVWPYLGNEAARGLAHATTAKGDSRWVDAAWRHLDWYASAMDDDGFVTDYRVEGGRLVSTGDMDSTDAYAATFLSAVDAAWAASRDVARLVGLRGAVRRAVGVIAATQDVDGLTWAKPGWHVKYLMDQAEVYAGLGAAARLAVPLGDVGLYVDASERAEAVRRGIDGLWNPAADGYDWAVHGDGTRVPPRWDRLYPDALSQVWTVAHGATRGRRAVGLVDRFAAAHPRWADPAVAGYWPTAADAHARVGYGEVAAAAVTSIRRYAAAAGRTWPYTPADAGRLIMSYR